MKIGIFGGSFNPIHKGHVAIAEMAIDSLNLDNLFFVPAYKSPFKDKRDYEEATHRVNMINLVKPEKSEVSLFEISRKGTSYTIDTVRYFKEKYPKAEIYLIIGSDNLYKLHKWKNIDEISSLVKIVVFRREGEFSKLNVKKYNCELLNNKIYDFSSTSFKSGEISNVPKEVIEYIGKNQLYVKDFMENSLDAKRHKHSIAVANLATVYAKQLGVSAKQAWVAGALHDITKGWTKEQHQELLNKYNDNNSYDKHELHSITGALWLEKEYCIADEEIISAVKKHTNLANELSTMDKVIYAADKLCDGRKWDGIQKLRELILKDFDKGFKELVSTTMKLVIEKEGSISKEQEEIYRRWM